MCKRVLVFCVVLLMASESAISSVNLNNSTCAVMELETPILNLGFGIDDEYVSLEIYDVNWGHQRTVKNIPVLDSQFIRMPEVELADGTYIVKVNWEIGSMMRHVKITSNKIVVL